MPEMKILGKNFAALAGRIATDSYSTTIKKLALLNAKSTTQNQDQKNAYQVAWPAAVGFVQVVPARFCAGWNHVFFALEHAVSAIDSRTAFSRKPELEFLIHFFSEKQLYKALDKARFRDSEALVLVIGKADGKNIEAAKKVLGFVEDGKAMEWEHCRNTKGIMKEFGITETELEAVSDLENVLDELVIERVSMVALEK